MHYSIENHLNLLYLAPVIFFVSIVLFLFIGWVFGKYRLQKSSDIVVRDSLATAIFGLSALVLGFTFSNATQHFDERIQLIRDQGYSVIQVIESSKYLAPADHLAVKKSLQDVLSLRLNVYENLHNFDELNQRQGQLIEALNQLNFEITNAILRAPASNKEAAVKILGPQQSHLMDVFQAGILNAKNHPPAIIERFLLILLSVGALLSGYSMAVQKEEDWFLTSLYIALMGFALYVIFALELPNQLQNPEYLNAELLRAQKILLQ